MPKRSLDVAMPRAPDPSLAKIQKTERSHEENQERAYIAASRRQDRSMEARVQSARMASEIHRKRTGRALKVSEEIVTNEEMYEEEEDEVPRQWRSLAPHLTTDSASMNNRVNNYLTTTAMMASMARYHEINKLFEESFPTAQTFMPPQQPSPIHLGYKATSPDTRTHPMSPASSTVVGSPVLDDKPASLPAQSTKNKTGRRDSDKASFQSPSVFSPALETKSAPQPTSTSSKNEPVLAQESAPMSSFTSELPVEAQQMMGFNSQNAINLPYWGEFQPQSWNAVSDQPSLSKGATADGNSKFDMSSFNPSNDVPSSGLFNGSDQDFSSFDFNMPWEDLTKDGSGENWEENFVDYGPEQ